MKYWTPRQGETLDSRLYKRRMTIIWTTKTPSLVAPLGRSVVFPAGHSDIHETTTHDSSNHSAETRNNGPRDKSLIQPNSENWSGGSLGSFVRLVDDSLLLRKVAGMKSVCIIGCPHCTNQSIGYAKDMSIIGKRRLGGFVYDAYAVTKEANRIRELLTNKGTRAKVRIFGALDSAPCQMHEKERRMVARACESTDAAITLCCNSGWEGIRTALPESFKVVQGMATLGTISAYLETEKGKDVLNKEKTKVMSFKELKQAIQA